MADDAERQHALEEYKNKLLESREWEAKLKALRQEIKGQQHDFDVSEELSLIHISEPTRRS